MVQAQSIGTVHVHQGGPPAGESVVPAEEWGRRAAGSPVWEHITAGREYGEHRRWVVSVAGRLSGIRDAAERELKGDPWGDGSVATRLLDQVEWVLGEAGRGEGLDLYPAEASLLVLTPFLYRTHYVRRAVELAGVRPWVLAPGGGAGGERRAFEVFMEGGEVLVQRARRDPGAEPLVGWWLFHRWLTQRREFTRGESVAELLGELARPGPDGEDARALGDALDPEWVAALLHGLRRGPDVCHPEFLRLLPADERVRCGPGHQQIRFQRVALVLAVAHAMSVEMTGLPDIVAEHLAIPYPVDLGELRRTLTGAGWGGSPELPVLRAECHHEAVVEGLREYTARADTLLDTVRRAVRERITQPMPPLPVRLSDGGVVPSGGTFDGYAKFRSDGRRVLDLAMGIELYKDRDLAVRELYQNALDACRYRRARGQYLDRTGVPTPYTGEITFTQGVDEAGRAYLECEDNGVGMGEAELRGVFSHAGARFAEQLEFRLERERWEALDPPVTLYPNSRFGIGVLSYFMLADEIRVSTCRMDREGVPGAVYEASICGPGHLFRIVRAARRGRPGTRVRLYLRADVDPAVWSCAEVLERVLGIAEFRTVVREGEARTRVWKAGVLRVRKDTSRSTSRSFALDAHGQQVPARDCPEGAQVIWCEQGGALLVDGLLVEPQTHTGVLSAKGSGLIGVVVNLSGPWSPARLSVDRRHVLDDVSTPVRKLLEGAADVLAESEAAVPGFAWLCRVADGSIPLADLIAARLLAAGRGMEFRGVTFGTPDTGFFPGDYSLLPQDVFDDGPYVTLPLTRVGGDTPDHIYLWRLLAHRPPGVLATLAEPCPEIEETGKVRTARPSDQWLLQLGRGGGRTGKWGVSPGLGDVAAVVEESGRCARDLALQLTALGSPGLDPRRWADDARLTPAVGRVFRDRGESRLTPDEPLSSTDLLWAAERMGETAATTAGLLGGFGFQVPEEVLALVQAADEEPLLLVDPERPTAGCLSPGAVVPPGHLVAAGLRCGLPVAEVRRRIEARGLPTAPFRFSGRLSQETLLLLSADADGRTPWLEAGRPAPPGQVLQVARKLGLTPAEVLVRLRAFGIPGPEVFPEDATTDDLWLLGSDYESAFYRPSRPLAYAEIFHHCDDLGMLRPKIRRMRAYGFTIPVAVPQRPTSLDAELLTESSPLEWWETYTDDTVPFSHVLMASRGLGEKPADVARRLRACGIATSHTALPKGLSSRTALRLIRAHLFDDGGMPEASDFPLEYLHRTAVERDTSITRVVELLRELGVPVPDPAETIRAALARVPRG
ncbi:ATP-binding protein [Streptomyces sp. NPDC057638]|uniref:wHTH domain-containing protein n=1 Tax=Streptomyces sp. NPDC057638 TaxID=3346190 RepID=UPI0036AA4E07